MAYLKGAAHPFNTGWLPLDSSGNPGVTGKAYCRGVDVTGWRAWWQTASSLPLCPAALQVGGWMGGADLVVGRSAVSLYLVLSISFLPYTHSLSLWCFSLHLCLGGYAQWVTKLCMLHEPASI